MDRLFKKISIITIAVFMILLAYTWSNWAVAAESNDHLTYRLKWLFNASVVGDIYADVQKIFSNEGLEVTIKEGGPERDAIKELELGYAQFGIASADQVIRALSKGSPIVVIAQLFQINPLQWIYRRTDPPIERLEDLKGRTIGITYGGNDETIMRTLLAKGKISYDEIKLFSVRYDYTPFYKRKVDIWPVYRNTQGIFISEKLHKEGEEVAFFIPAEFGVKFVANSVVTSERMMREHPKIVQRFIRALLRGWRESLDPANEKKALETLQQFDKDTSLHILRKQLAVTRKLIKPKADIDIGSIDMEAWKQTEQIMLNQKQIPKPVFVEKVLKGKF